MKTRVRWVTAWRHCGHLSTRAAQSTHMQMCSQPVKQLGAASRHATHSELSAGLDDELALALAQPTAEGDKSDSARTATSAALSMRSERHTPGSFGFSGSPSAECMRPCP